ncbi:NlpC/P60 family protein [Bacteroidales bacterium KA00251]|nr:NlpC/P60 family protein [Bacteroidales bacterium KA00251]
MKIPQNTLLRKIGFIAFLSFVFCLVNGCGLRAVTLTAEDFRLSDEVAVYNEKGNFLPHPDCLAYTKLAVKPTEDFIQDLIKLGKRYLGKPYRYRGASPWPFDCSGYMRFLFGSFGVKLPGSSAAISQATIPVKQPVPGDLVFFKGRNRKSNRVGHVALVVEVKSNGGIVMLHSTNQRGVVIEEVDKNYYFSSRFLDVRRIPKLDSQLDSSKKEKEDGMEIQPPRFVHGTLVPEILQVPSVISLQG